MVAIGLMAAVVFVVTMYLSIRIPTPTGTTMIKLANAFILLCGLLIGPVCGGQKRKLVFPCVPRNMPM